MLNNKKVTTINGLDRAKLDQFRRQTFERLKSQGMNGRQAAVQAKTATHRKIAAAEIRQDRMEAKKSKDMALMADASVRLSVKLQVNFLQTQFKINPAGKRRFQLFVPRQEPS